MLIITLRPFCADCINLSSGSASLVLISLLRRFWSPSMRIARQQGGSDSRIAAVLRKSKSAFIGIFVLSAALNVLLLGGAIYMMMVYDVVLQIGRAHVRTPVTNAHLVCSLLLDIKNAVLF